MRFKRNLFLLFVVTCSAVLGAWAAFAQQPPQANIDPDQPALRRRLRREVEAAFEARQKLQRAELGRLREQLTRIEKSIAAREKIKDKIIDHRVEELLNPNLRWPSGVQTSPPKMTIDSSKSMFDLTNDKTQLSLDARVIAVSSKVSNMIAISVGWENGLRPGHTLDVFRKNTYLGRIVIRRADSGRFISIAEILQSHRKGGIKKGDRVSLRPADSISAAAPMNKPMNQPAARAYRDVLQKRIKLLEEQYTAGQIALVELLTARKDFYDAEMAAAETAQQREKAHRRKIDHLKQLKKVVEAQFMAGVVTQTDVLAVEAELFRAQAGLDPGDKATGRPGDSPSK